MRGRSVTKVKLIVCLDLERRRYGWNDIWKNVENLAACNKMYQSIYFTFWYNKHLQIVTGGFNSWWDIALSKSTEITVGLLIWWNRIISQLWHFIDWKNSAMAKFCNCEIFIFLLFLSPSLLSPCCTREDTGIYQFKSNVLRKLRMQTYRKPELPTVSGVPMQRGLLPG